MRAITIQDRNLVEAELPDPEPRPGEVLIDVVAAGINRADILQLRGHYPPPPGAPDTLGLECSGTVAAVGEGVTRWRPGDRVAALLAGGGYAERVAVPQGQLLPVHGDLVEAAALPEALCTAWSNLVMVGKMQPGETVLIHGGSGGVGTVAIQLAKALGATVVTTAGGPERVARCLELGADIGIDHRAEELPRNIDLILDLLGAGGLAANMRALRVGGRLVIIGLQRGSKGEIDLNLLLAKRLTIHGTTLRSRPDAEKAAIVAEVEEQVWPLVGTSIRPVVHAVLPLSEAAQGQRMIERGEAFGKVLLTTR